MLSKFTRPDRSNYTPNLEKSPTNDQLDFGWNEGFFSDGRRYRVEAWAQDGLTSVTVFTPTFGIETMSNDQFVQLFERECLIAWEPGARKSAYAIPFTDAAGVSLWSVNVVIGDDERIYARDAFKLRPYGSRDAQPGSDSADDEIQIESTLGEVPEDEPDEDDRLPSEDDDLRELDNFPDNLLAWGYTREEESTTSAVRWVRYGKIVESSESQVRLNIAIEYELGISDEPTLSFDEARSYSFNGVRMEVCDRRMDAIDNIYFDEETERPTIVGHTYLSLTTLREVEDLVRLLRFETSRF